LWSNVLGKERPSPPPTLQRTLKPRAGFPPRFVRWSEAGPGPLPTGHFLSFAPKLEHDSMGWRGRLIQGRSRSWAGVLAASGFCKFLCLAYYVLRISLGHHLGLRNAGGFPLRFTPEAKNLRLGRDVRKKTEKQAPFACSIIWAAALDRRRPLSRPRVRRTCPLHRRKTRALRSMSNARQKISS